MRRTGHFELSDVRKHLGEQGPCILLGGRSQSPVETVERDRKAGIVDGPLFDGAQDGLDMGKGRSGQRQD